MSEQYHWFFAASIVFTVLPILVLDLTLRDVYMFLLGGVAVKWFIFGAIDYGQKHGDKLRGIVEE